MPAEALVARARELAPVLAGRIGAMRELRRIPDETIADLEQAGFFAMLQPEAWGGAEVHPSTFFDVQMIVETTINYRTVLDFPDDEDVIFPTNQNVP